MLVVYANQTVLQDVCLTILAKHQIFLNEAKRDEIRNKTPREIMNMDRKTELKRLL